MLTFIAIGAGISSLSFLAIVCYSISKDWMMSSNYFADLSRIFRVTQR